MNSIYHGGIPGNTGPDGAYVSSIVIEDLDQPELSPEVMLLSKCSETDGKVCYLLASTQTGASTVGLWEALQKIADALATQIGLNILGNKIAED